MWRHYAPGDGSMTFDISPSSLATEQRVSSIMRPSSSGQSAGPASSVDTVDISKAARKRLDITAAIEAARNKKQTEPDSWQSLFDLKSGSITLRNGNTQITTINGANMELLEYRNGALVKKETGVIDGDKVVWETERYDVRGRIVQKNRTELSGLNQTDAASKASMRRDVQWFEDGELIRELHDGMHVQVSSEAATLKDAALPAEIGSLEDLAGKLTRDVVSSDYLADIVEYAGGKVSQTASIRNGLDAVNFTNRNTKIESGMDPRTTHEFSNLNSLSVQLTRYDSDGKVLAQMDLADSVVKGESLTQTVSVSWYDKGELVRQEKGSLTLEPGEGKKLPERPGILETFGISEDTFSGNVPLSSGGLLAASREETAGTADVFVHGLGSGMASGAFGMAENLAVYRDAENPYSLSFTSRTYRDGELAAESTDTEEVRESYLPEEVGFRPGKGLTEDELPRTLRTSTHEESAYENGALSAHGGLSMREFVKKNEDGVFALYTHYSGETGLGGDAQPMSGTRAGSLEILDGDANAASAGMARSAELAVGDARALFTNLGRA